MSERVWEVFRQEDEGDPMIHAGNVNAPDEELALHYAREFYGRRGESNRLWIVPRDSITELDDPDLLKPPLVPEKVDVGLAEKLHLCFFLLLARSKCCRCAGGGRRRARRAYETRRPP